MRRLSDDGKVGAVFVVVLLVAIICFMLWAFGGCEGFGLGFGNGLVKSTDKNKNDTSTDESDKDKDITEVTEDTTDDGKVVVFIEENRVTIRNTSISDENELKKYIEDVNTDSTTYEIHEKNSILATHQWVQKVFEDMELSPVYYED